MINMMIYQTLALLYKEKYKKVQILAKKFNYLMNHIPSQIFKITLNISLKNMEKD